MVWALGLLALFFNIPDGFNCFSEGLHYSHITMCTERECQARRSPAINNLFSLLQETSSRKSKGLTHTHTHTHKTHTYTPERSIFITQILIYIVTHTHSYTHSTFSSQPVFYFFPLLKNVHCFLPLYHQPLVHITVKQKSLL